MIPELEAEFALLKLESFNEDSALQLGQILLALAAGKPVVINIRAANRTYFHAALPGSTPLNDLWALRKSNTALMFGLPSLLVGERNRAKGESLAVHGLSEAEYADHGGAVPIVPGLGQVVAAATVSGLASQEDHRLVVTALQELQLR